MFNEVWMCVQSSGTVRTKQNQGFDSLASLAVFELLKT